jgi:hypothetical protein
MKMYDSAEQADTAAMSYLRSVLDDVVEDGEGAGLSQKGSRGNWHFSGFYDLLDHGETFKVSASVKSQQVPCTVGQERALRLEAGTRADEAEMKHQETETRALQKQQELKSELKQMRAELQQCQEHHFKEMNEARAGRLEAAEQVLVNEQKWSGELKQFWDEQKELEEDLKRKQDLLERKRLRSVGKQREFQGEAERAQAKQQETETRALEKQQESEREVKRMRAELQSLRNKQTVLSESVAVKRERIEEDEESKECKICLDEQASFAVHPCGHLCLCRACVQLPDTLTNGCPICREAVDGTIYGNLPLIYPTRHGKL